VKCCFFKKQLWKKRFPIFGGCELNWNFSRYPKSVTLRANMAFSARFCHRKVKKCSGWLCRKAQCKTHPEVVFYRLSSMFDVHSFVTIANFERPVDAIRTEGSKLLCNSRFNLYLLRFGICTECSSATILI